MLEKRFWGLNGTIHYAEDLLTARSVFVLLPECTAINKIIDQVRSKAKIPHLQYTAYECEFD